MKVKIYLDDERIPLDENWVVVKDYYEFVEAINKYNLENISVITLDHDLGDKAKLEYYTNVKRKNNFNYDNLDNEKTGLDCCKFLVEKCLDENKKLPQIFVHSKNPVGRLNMMDYINNYLEFIGETRSCVYNPIPHTLRED